MPRRSGYDLALEAIAAAGFLAMCLLVTTEWNRLPERIPTHFGFSGQPDAWGSRDMLWVLPLVNAGLWILLTLASKHQRLVNLPFDVDRDSFEVRKTILTMTVALKAVLMWIGYYLVWATVRTATEQISGLGEWFVPLLLAGTLGTVGIFGIKLRRLRQS